jgi:hypothetical protein
MTMTYNSLLEQIKSYMIRDNDAKFIAQLPNFISQAEFLIGREKVRGKPITIGFEQYVHGTFIAGNAVIAKPARWRRNITFNFGTGEANTIRNPILFRKYEYLRNYWPDDTKTSIPKFYADYGFSHLLIAPTPDQAYPFEYCYLETPPPLSPQNQTNWLTDFAPDVLLYGSLIQSVAFLQNDDRLPVWQSIYQAGIESLADESEKRSSDRSSNKDAD